MGGSLQSGQEWLRTSSKECEEKASTERDAELSTEPVEKKGFNKNKTTIEGKTHFIVAQTKGSK